MSTVHPRSDDSSTALQPVSFNRDIAAYWFAQPVRWQLLLTFLAVTIAASSIAAVLLVLDARQRTLAEMSGAMAIAEQFVREVTKDVTDQQTAENLSGSLAAQLGQVRHVEVKVLYGQNHPNLSSVEAEHDPPIPAERAASTFMVDLLGLSPAVRVIPVAVGGKTVATVLISGNPDDEFSEAWAGLETIGYIWIGTNVAIFLVFYVVMGRILQPLAGVADGMRRLEDDDLAARVPLPRAQELHDIANSFNHLAENLEQVTDENAQLFRQLIDVQERERRRIAGELHDEVGPCLFGLMTNASSIEKLAGSLPDEEREKVAGRIGELKHICDRLKQFNRTMLNSLFPIAAGHVTITDLVTKLVSDYEGRHPEVSFELVADKLAPSYGEETDLLLYRAMQEGIANALRHGGADRICVNLETVSANDRGKRQTLFLNIADNGCGMSADVLPGFGLLTMQKRVSTRGGKLAVKPNSPGGVRIEIRLPLSSERIA